MPCHLYFVFVPSFVFLLLNVAQCCQTQTIVSRTMNLEGTTISLEGTTLVLEGTTLVLEGTTVSLEWTTLKFPGISTVPCHAYFMFVLNLILLLLAPKPTAKEKRPLYASRTHKVAALTHVQGYFAAADHPSVPHQHICSYTYWSIDKTDKFNMGKQSTFLPNFQ